MLLIVKATSALALHSNTVDEIKAVKMKLRSFAHVFLSEIQLPELATAVSGTAGHPLQPPATVPEEYRSCICQPHRDLLDSLKGPSTASDIYFSFLLHPMFLYPDYTPPSTDVSLSHAPLE